VLVALAVWHPLLANFFYNDDFVHLFDLVTLPLHRFILQLWGGHLYVVRNSLFALTYEAFGPDPRAFFGTVLVTHALNVWLLHRLVRIATGDRLLAVAASVLWGAAPVHDGTLGWYSVYGQVAQTALLLVAMALVAELIASERPLSSARAVALTTLLVLSAGCFGTGLAIVAAAPIVVALVLRPPLRRPTALVMIGLGAAAVLGLYAWLRVRSPIVSQFGDPLAPRGILHDLPAAAVMAWHLFAFEALVLVAGSLGASLTYPSPVAAAAAGVVVALVVGTFAASDAGTRRRMVLPALFLGAALLAIALGRGHFMQMFDLSLARSAAWPRYHYVSLALLVTTLATGLAALRRRPGVTRALVTLLVGGWTIARLVTLSLHPLAIDHHDRERLEVETLFGTLREQALAAPVGTDVAVANRPFKGFTFPEPYTGWAAVFVVFAPDDTIAGRRIHFVGSARDWAIAEPRGGRIAALLRPR
jgi:hypothetical protein